MKALHLGLAAGGALAALGATAALSMAPPPEAKPAPDQCFRADMVRNFAAVDEEHLYLRVGIKGAVYALDMHGACPGLEQADSVSIGSRACVGSPAAVVVVTRDGRRLARGAQLCRALVTAKLTPEEVAALPGRARP